MQQIIYNQIATHLSQMPNRATNGRGEAALCQYRTASGNMCAVGCLIHPEDYFERMEEFSVRDLIWNFACMSKFEDYEDLLADFQNLHDKESSWTHEGKMKERLARLASQHGLHSEILKRLTFPMRPHN